MMHRPVLIALVALDLLLPTATVVLYSAGRLLGAMEDGAGQAVLTRVSQACGILWVLGLVALLIALAVDSLTSRNPPRGDG